ncbi:MAG: hypothetical protein HC820_08035 [Hydrococcus sp. RM1_1_31]|nr:hypothetical protein [Hydrococcus sp. RM1_1_31]
MGGVAIAQAALTMLPILAIGTVTYVVAIALLLNKLAKQGGMGQPD